MQIRKRHPTNRYIWIGALVSAAQTAIIGITAANLSGFEIVGKTVPFAYPWRLSDWVIRLVQRPVTEPAATD